VLVTAMVVLPALIILGVALVVRRARRRRAQRASMQQGAS
jgi:hypothetical protein